jgi:DNA-binding NarL/FixJ family response regulator
VLVDYQLSDLDGVATTRLMKAAVPGASVILMTESRDETVVAAAIAAGCAGVVDKDRAWVELVGAVSGAYRGETIISHEELQRVLPILRDGRRRGSGGVLTDRERDVLSCISEGLSNRAVAERLGVTANTVRNHVQRILYKLNVHSKLEAVVVAAQERLLGDRP